MAVAAAPVAMKAAVVPVGVVPAVPVGVVGPASPVGVVVAVPLGVVTEMAEMSPLPFPHPCPQAPTQ